MDKTINYFDIFMEGFFSFFHLCPSPLERMIDEMRIEVGLPPRFTDHEGNKKSFMQMLEEMDYGSFATDKANLRNDLANVGRDMKKVIRTINKNLPKNNRRDSQQYSQQCPKKP